MLAFPENPPSFVDPAKFITYFELPTEKLKTAKLETVSVIPIPDGIPFIAYYHNKVLHSAWTYTDKIRKRERLPGLKRDIGTRWLKTRVTSQHHDFFIGIITVTKKDLAGITNLPRFIRAKIKDPDSSSISLRYVVTAVEYSCLVDRCTPCGDEEWQMRYAHQHDIKSAVQLGKSFKDEVKKVKNVVYNHLSGGLQVKSTRLEKDGFKDQVAAIAKTVKKYSNYPINRLKICDKTPYTVEIK